MSFPKEYANFITETNLPAEENELNELKDSVQQVINELTQKCQAGVITFGKMCSVHEIGSIEVPVSYTLNWEKAYKGIETQEQLGLLTVNLSNPNEGTFNTHHPKFLMPVGEVGYICPDKLFLLSNKIFQTHSS